MGRVFVWGAFSVYVFCEKGTPHHLPHCHVKKKGTSVATINVLTGKPLYPPSEELPRSFLDEMGGRLGEIVAAWEALNEDEQ